MAQYPFGVVQVAAEEVRTDRSYFFDNQHRPDGSGLVIQLTIEGAAFYRDNQGEHLVTQGNAMLFSHEEATAYGYPPEATEPYRPKLAPVGAKFGHRASVREPGGFEEAGGPHVLQPAAWRTASRPQRDRSHPNAARPRSNPRAPRSGRGKSDQYPAVRLARS